MVDNRHETLKYQSHSVFGVCWSIIINGTEYPQYAFHILLHRDILHVPGMYIAYKLLWNISN